MDIFQEVEEDDFKTVISIETYMEKRMKPLLKYYRTWAPKLKRRLSYMQNLEAVVSALTVALAIPGSLSHWVTFAVSIKALIMNVIQYQADGKQLSALNVAVRDLQNLMT